MGRYSTQHNIAHALSLNCTVDEMIEFAKMYLSMYNYYGSTEFCEKADQILSHLDFEGMGEPEEVK